MGTEVEEIMTELVRAGKIEIPGDAVPENQASDGNNRSGANVLGHLAGK